MKEWMKVAAVTAMVAAVAVTAGCTKAPGPAPTADKGAEAPKAAADDKPIKVGYLPITHSAPLMIADAEEGGAKLELVKFASWPELTEALNAGRIDGAVTMLELALAGRAKGLPLKVVSLAHLDGDAITGAKDIGSVADLKGKRVAIPHRMSGQNIMLKLALEREGLSLEDVTLAEMAPPEMPAALAAKSVSAYVVAEPFGTMAVGKGFGKTLVRADELWKDWPCCALVTTERFAQERPEALQALVSDVVEAGSKIEADRDAAAETASAYTKFDAKVWKASFGLGVRYGELTPDATAIDKLQGYLLDMKLLPKKVDVDSLIDTSFVEKAYTEQ